ncbi:hypothetical protein [Gordonia sihwensis]|uniref:hypothetical protein n=1 Tax=Gordonia sihwensis TaxID=173559 RepID=UPI003D998C97
MDVPKYLGGAAVTAVVAGLLTYLGAVIIGGIMANWIPASYWPDHGLARPVIDAALWAWTGAAAAILAAAVMWALIKVTPVPARFFSALSVLAAIGAATAMLTSGPWQTVILPAVLALIVVMVIGSLTALYTRYTITTPRRPQ